MAYWLVVGNHLFFIKTKEMNSDLIKSYVEWLLKIRTKVLHSDSNISLSAELDRTQSAGDIGEIRNIRVAGKAAPQLVVSPPPDVGGRSVATSRRVADRLVQYGQALPIVEAIFGKARADSLVESLGPEEYLAVDASVKVRGRRTAESRARLRSIVDDVADMSDAAVTIEGKDGRVSDGDAILRTRMPFTLPNEGGNLLEFDNVADQLQEVYRRFVEDGKIKA